MLFENNYSLCEIKFYCGKKITIVTFTCNNYYNLRKSCSKLTALNAASISATCLSLDITAYIATFLGQGSIKVDADRSICNILLAHAH